MSFLIKLILILLIQNTLQANPILYKKIFLEVLLEYNIVYDNLENFKAGAICLPNTATKSYNKYAVGYSYAMYEKKNAINIAIAGCKEMKKKLISYECKCEIIYK